MELKGKRIGYCFTGSFCTFESSIKEMEKLVKEEKAEVFPIMSYNSYNLDSKFGTAEYFKEKIKRITRKNHYSHNSRSRTNWSKRLT